MRSHGSSQLEGLALLKTDFLTIGMAANRHESLYGHAGNFDSERCGDLTISRLHGNSGIAIAGRSDQTVFAHCRHGVAGRRPRQLRIVNGRTVLVIGHRVELLRSAVRKRRGNHFVIIHIKDLDGLDLCAGLVISNVPRLLSSIAIHLGERPR